MAILGRTMDKGKARTEQEGLRLGADGSDARQRATFMDVPTLFDVGIGVLYFFTSHMIIRAMYYVGLDRSSTELAIFFAVVIGSAIAAHLFARALLRARLFIESSLGVPAVSMMAAVGAVMALVSMLPSVGSFLFYCSGALLGLSCGCIIVIWTSTMHARRPDHNSFYLHPSLVVAVACYFLFRCVSSFSDAVSQGFLLALPLVSIFCIIKGAEVATRSLCERGRVDSVADEVSISFEQACFGDEDEGEEALRSIKSAVVIGGNARALQVLVVVAAAFALGCSVAVSLSGHEESVLASGLNNMVLFEALAVVAVVLCCGIMSRFSSWHTSSDSSKGVAVLVFCFVYVPMFAVGLLMGSAGVPDRSPDALWETSMWVLLIAIFAYDIRDTPYAIKGLAVGLMFEAMCVGQMIARMACTGQSAVWVSVSVLAAVAYFLGVALQFFKGPAKARRAKAEKVVKEKSKPEGACVQPDGQRETSKVEEDVSAVSDAPDVVDLYCHKLALENGLTPREAEVLALMAMGRSAKYIAEELVVSHNTTRTHIKHIYEKLNIHSKQELIDLVLYGLGSLRD